jgi:hypothetical protein
MKHSFVKDFRKGQEKNIVFSTEETKFGNICLTGCLGDVCFSEENLQNERQIKKAKETITKKLLEKAIPFQKNA